MTTAFNIATRYLSGIEHVLSFSDQSAMAAAANHLLVCHPHHFAVLADRSHSLAVSQMGLDCLQQWMDETPKEVSTDAKNPGV